MDSLLLRDLMVLARERAMATAVLVGGDEDLREGVAAVQDMGVRVQVVGVDTEERNQAESLLREADEVAMLTVEQLQPFFRRVSTEEVLESTTEEEAAARIGREFARACVENLGRERLSALLTDYPSIPSDLDAQLLKQATEALGPLRQRFDLKVALRAAFWEGISLEVASDYRPG